MSTSRALAHLVLPRWCPGCGRSEVSVCAECAQGLRHWFRAESAAESLPAGLPVWAVGAYEGPTARVLMAWKSGHRPDLAPVIARLGTVIGAHLAADPAFRAALAGSLPAGPAPRADPPGELILVPAPSGWRRRWRGREVVAPLASAIAAGLSAEFVAGSSAGFAAELATGPGVSVQSLVRRRGGSNHGLSAQDRARERHRSIGLARRTQVPAGSGFLLVDDILTTGSTLAASAGALGVLGPVRGAIVLAATPKPVQRGAESTSDYRRF